MSTTTPEMTNEQVNDYMVGDPTQNSTASATASVDTSSLLTNFYKKTPAELKALSTALKNAGYSVSVTSSPTARLRDQYAKSYFDFIIFKKSMPNSPVATVEDFLSTFRKDASTGQPRVSESFGITTPETAATAIKKYYQEMLYRDPTQKEIDSLTKKLNAAENKNPTKTVTKKVDGKTQTFTTPGISSNQFLIDSIAKTKEYKKNLGTAPDLLKRNLEKREYDNLIKGKTAEQVSEINKTNRYGRGFSEVFKIVSDYATKVGTIDDATKAQIARDIYDTANEGNQGYIQQKVNEKIAVTPGATATGEVGKNLADLRAVAKANGIDLDKQFGLVLTDWVQKLDQGEKIDTYKQIIRDVAKRGLPENIGALMDKGVDLETIYSPYKRAMANTLEVNEESITLDDPILRSAITAEGEKTLYDYQRSLRKDPRWQYTNNARDEVSTIVGTVLRDFGFQG